jgi:hypothetical protein
MLVLTGRFQAFLYTQYMNVGLVFASGRVKLCYLTRISDVVVTEKRVRLILVGVLVSFGATLRLSIDCGPIL